MVKEYSEKKKNKVVVAMSGGVDSSVAAALLKKQGYEVVGVFMRFWAEADMTADYGLPSTTKNNSPQPPLTLRGGSANTNTCCSEGAEQAARNVAAKLKIPFYVLNLQKEFKKEVVDYFLAEEKLGRTPNPCVACNKKIKFGVMFEKAMALGADYIATGHYVSVKKIVIPSPVQRDEESPRILRGNAVPHSREILPPPLRGQNDNTIYKLFAAKDKDKDQSYFLYTLTQEKLAKILFPLADYEKSEVYELAKKWRLPYRKDESFDLCFVSDSRENFLRRRIKMKDGKIYRFNAPQPPLKLRGDEGELLGAHQGLALYTIGQRKNVPLSRGPWRVAAKDAKKNILYVSNNENDLYGDVLTVSRINWLSGQTPKMPLKVLAKIRYKTEACSATLRLASHGSARSGRNLLVTFKKPQRAPTPGQSIVFYKKNGELLAGGIITGQSRRD